MVFVDVEIERVVGVLGRAGGGLRLLPGDDLAHVLDEGLAFGDVLHGKDALAMDAGATGLNAAADSWAFFGHG